MIEQRKLTREEVRRVIHEASDEERAWMEFIAKEMGCEPYDILTKHSEDWDGLVVDGRPIYFAGIFRNNGRHEFWTVVNRNVSAQFSLFKRAKRSINLWLSVYGSIYATMKKSWIKNVLWTERIGFSIFSDTKDTVTFVINKER